MKTKFTPNFDHPALGFTKENLKLDDEELFVIGYSTALDIFGVLERDPHDIDGVAEQDTIQRLRKQMGFEVVRRVVGYKKDGTPVEILATTDAAGRFDIHRWMFSMDRWRRTGKGRVYMDELLEKSVRDPHTGMYVATPELVVETKHETGRPQDQSDLDAFRRLARHT